ncbi:MAG: very short patch repair endonuclease [Verrucomicrobiota bacterium]
MADIWTRANRSEVMARIRGRGNRSTEGRLASFFRGHGITGWRRQWPLPGRPDFAFPARRLAVFVDGCFWHGCPRHGTLPRGNRAFWRAKLTRNRERDREVNAELRRRGWTVLRVGEHALQPRHERRLLARLRRRLQ